MPTDTVTQINQPWGPQGTGLEFGWGKGKNLFNAQFGKPFDPYGPTSKAALAGTKAIASGNNPFMGPATDAVTGVASGANGITTGSMFGDIYSGAQGPGQLNTGMFGDIATGEMVGANNPMRNAALQDALGQTEARIKSSMSSAGRVGSDFYGEGMARGLGGVAADFNLNAYNSDMDRMMTAAQAGSAEDLARRGIQLSATSGQTGVEGQNIGNRMTAAGMAPQMSDFRYADAREMAKTGGAEDAMQEAIRNNDWGTLSKYLGMFGGVPGSSGTSTTEQPGQSDWLSLLGGAATGAGLGSMFGGLGSLVGAGAGALGNWIFG